MIAVVVARPLDMGPWFANTYFNGDYSLSQRASVLTAMSIAARELAGYGDDDAALTGTDALPKSPFPSKRLPAQYAHIYAAADATAPADAAARQLEDRLIKPMALALADQVSGPNVLKVRTFSSRMAVELRRKRPVPNELAKIVATGFFFPLAGRWHALSQFRYVFLFPKLS